MKFLFDLNVWLDMAIRPDSQPESAELYRFLEGRGDSICLPLCGYTTLHYILSEVVGSEGAAAFLASLRKRGVRLLGFTEKEVLVAEQLAFQDYEDACVAATAVRGSCDHIVTRNTKDFRTSPVPAKTPKTLLSIL